MKYQITKEEIRAVGGIVHGDGNIFFTSLEQLNAAMALATRPPVWDRVERALERGYATAQAAQPTPPQNPPKGWMPDALRRAGFGGIEAA